MAKERESSASIIRHGNVEGISQRAESGEKPPYETFKDFMEGKIDPSIDRETTKKNINEAVDRGEIKKDDFNVIICTDARRGQETAALINEILKANVPIRPVARLREVKVSFEKIPRETYENCKDIKEVRRLYLNLFLNGEGTIDEDPVALYHRAQRVIDYFNKIRSLTEANPLFITHGILLRTLELAINHLKESLNDEQIKKIMQEELPNIPLSHVLGGLICKSSEESGLQITGRLDKLCKVNKT